MIPVYISTSYMVHSEKGSIFFLKVQARLHVYVFDRKKLWLKKFVNQLQNVIPVYMSTSFMVNSDIGSIFFCKLQGC